MNIWGNYLDPDTFTTDKIERWSYQCCNVDIAVFIIDYTLLGAITIHRLLMISVLSALLNIDLITRDWRAIICRQVPSNVNPCVWIYHYGLNVSWGIWNISSGHRESGWISTISITRSCLNSEFICHTRYELVYLETCASCWASNIWALTLNRLINSILDDWRSTIILCFPS